MIEALKDVPCDRLRQFMAVDASNDPAHPMMFQAVQSSLRQKEPAELARKMADEALEIFSGIDQSAASSAQKSSAIEAILQELDAVISHIRLRWPAARGDLDIFGALDQAVQRGNLGLAKWRDERGARQGDAASLRTAIDFQV